jgi:hypothetical protein
MRGSEEPHLSVAFQLNGRVGDHQLKGVLIGLNPLRISIHDRHQM